MPEEKKDFVVKDRRIFTEENEDIPAEKGESSEDPKDGAEDAADAVKDESFGNDEALGQFPQIDFATFIFSLNSSAYVQLGLIEEPGAGKKTKNLVLAKQTIDILGMLEEKTKGNLTPEEENLLKNFLFDLRMKYIKETK